MSTESTELLRRYWTEKSEAAFTELVERHIDLVYSAALRQVNGDTAAAEDVTQAVFTELAHKAPRLLRHTSLTGWLYTGTRYLAAKARRTEQRRRAREQHAYAMNQILQATSPEPTWEDLRPVLDEVMHELGGADREAVLMRYFEGRPLADIGARLGLTENAARMRVERALDRLREALARRGVASTAAVLAGLLTQRAVGAAPAELARGVSRSAMLAGAGGGGLVAGILGWLTAMKMELLLGGAVAILLVSVPLFVHGTRGNDHATAGERASNPQAQGTVTPGAADGLTAPAPEEAAALVENSSNQLVVHIVAADSGKAVPNGEIERWVWQSTKVEREQPLRASRFGVCRIPVLRALVTHLVLVSHVDGFADTRLEWRTERGQTIPPEYTLRLRRSVPIGGKVVDADGQPVAGALVGFNNSPDPSLEGTGPQTENFGWPFYATTRTDPQGQWQIDRIAKETLRTIYGSASHMQYVGSETVWFGRDANAAKQLLAGSHVFHLGRGVAVRGTVTDADGQPVAGAHVLVGRIADGNSHETKTGDDGTFSVSGCGPGKSLLTADAKGYAPTTMEVQLAADSEPLHLILKPGHLLRLRVVDNAGQSVPDASVWLNPFDYGINPANPKAPLTQIDFNRKTDKAGLLEWDSAPDGELNFAFSASGYMRVDNAKLRADGQEHTITMSPALTIYGTVRDASSGQPIPKFRVVTGWPVSNPVEGTTNAAWSTIDRFWLNFDGGKFRHVYEEPVVGGTAHPEFVFKFEAEGYAAAMTRTVAADEKEVRFDIALQPAAESVITVLTTDGRPAPNVDVGLVSPGARLELMPGGLSRRNPQSGGTLLLTDEHGQFKLPSDETITRVIATAAEGYAEAAPATLASNPTIQLQPLGQLQGTYLTNGQGAAGQTLLFQYGTGDFNTVSSDFNAYQVKTDGSGHFAFEQVPPGKHMLVQLVQAQINPGGMGWTHRFLEEVEIRPGETTTVTVSGCRVVARFTWPGGIVDDADAIVQAALISPSLQPPDELRMDPSAMATWRSQPEIRAAMRKTKYFGFTRTTDGTFSANDVPAGNYALSVTLAGKPAAGGEPKTLGMTTVSVTVPANPSSEVLDLGEIPLTLTQ